jgi:nucleotide-binding universal stress UspA family protein
MAELEVDLVVAPVDGSEESRTAVEYAVTVADKYDATVHALYILGETTVRAIDRGAVAEEAVADDTKAFSEAVTELAAGADVDLTTSIAAGFSTDIKTLHPGGVVLDTAEQLDADFVVMPREPTTDASSDVLETAAEYVLQYASQPVLSV